MKIIELNPIEYITNFRKIAKFKFMAWVLEGNVYVQANITKLEQLGY